MSYGTNAPVGLVPTNYSLGAIWNGTLNEYPILSGYATSLFQGDPVKQLNNGTIGIGVASTAIVGVFQGCTYFDSLGNFQASPYWPASTATLGTQNANALICDDPNVLFNIQVSTSSTANPTVPVGLALTDFNNNASFAIGGGTHFNANVPPIPNNPLTGNTRNGNSGYYLDITTLDVAATLSLKLVRLTPVPGNNYNTIAAPFYFNNALVLINNHVYKGGTGTVGI